MAQAFVEVEFLWFDKYRGIDIFICVKPVFLKEIMRVPLGFQFFTSVSIDEVTKEIDDYWLALRN